MTHKVTILLMVITKTATLFLTVINSTVIIQWQLVSDYGNQGILKAARLACTCRSLPGCCGRHNHNDVFFTVGRNKDAYAYLLQIY